SIHPPISVITRYFRTPLHPRSTFSLFLPGSSFVIVFLFSSHQVALSPISDTHIPCSSALPSQSNGRFLLAPNGTIPSRARGVIPRITVHTSRVRRPSPDKHCFLLFCHPESTHSLGSSTDRQSSTPSVPLKALSLFFLFLPLLFLLLFPYLHLPDSSQDHQPVNPSPSQHITIEGKHSPKGHPTPYTPGLVTYTRRAFHRHRPVLLGLGLNLTE
ncbi:hypothetical protein CCUS01_08419, partial [Colletotrichum cuscutae]